ncbi:MAG: toxin-antitoxin system YwqK family antitoxin [Bacteroidales bacterium]|nr:toxin-antitoxin system YwqK family antitoxin [Bacteroidales bacterium]
MKRFALILVTLLLAVATAVAQDFNQTDAKGRRQGSWRDFYPNGQLRYEGQFKNDKCKGTFKYYDEQGNLKATNEFDKSGDKALNKTYAPNGRVVATGYYVNQKKEGEWKYFDAKSGQLRLVEDNKNGKVQGWSKLYNPNNGVLVEEMQYVEGQPEGKCRKYSDTGVLIMECQYHSGLLDGLAKTYYPSSALKEEGQYSKGEKVGLWKTYNEDGDIIAEEAFGEPEIN